MNISQIKNYVEGCQKCPLYADMPVSPIVAEHSKIDDKCVVFVFDSPSERASIMSEVVSDGNRWALFRCLKDWDIPWYATCVKKCAGAKNVGFYKKCSKWLSMELEALPKDKIIIIFGKSIKRYVSSTAQQYVFSNWSRTFNNTASMNKLSEIIKEWKNK